MWAGSVRNGLINIKEVGMKTYQDVLPGQNYGLSEKTILSIYQDHDNQIWIGTDGGGINLFDPATGKFHHILSTWEEKRIFRAQARTRGRMTADGGIPRQKTGAFSPGRRLRHAVSAG